MTPSRLPPEAFEEAAAVLRAVAHPLRLRLLEILGQEEECNVGRLCALAGSAQPLVSHQLARMRHGGVLSARREGPQVFYRVARPEILDVLECVRRAARRGRSS